MLRDVLNPQRRLPILSTTYKTGYWGSKMQLIHNNEYLPWIAIGSVVVYHHVDRGSD